MKKVDENCEGLAIEETLFGMNFASRGLAWADNVLQKLENVNLEDIIPKNPSKYVDAVGEHLRKVCEDVADDWLSSFSDGFLKVPVSDLSLEHEVIAEICGNSKIALKECPIIEKLPSDTALGSEAGGDLALGICSQIHSENCDSVDVPQSGHLEESHDTCQKDTGSGSVTHFERGSVGVRESNPEDNSRSEVWCASISSSTSFIDTFYQSGLAESRVSDHGSTSFASSSEENVRYIPDKQVSHTPSDIQDAFDMVKTNERLDISDGDRADFLMIDVPVDVNSEVIMDAVLEESWANLEEDNLVFVADRSWQGSSYRRRIRNAFRPKKDPKRWKETLEAETWCKIKHPNSSCRKRGGDTKTAISKEDSTTSSIAAKDLGETEWEVL